MIPPNTNMTKMMVILPSNIINHGWDANVDSENADPLSPIRNVCYGYVEKCKVVYHPLNFE